MYLCECVQHQDRAKCGTHFVSRNPLLQYDIAFLIRRFTSHDLDTSCRDVIVCVSKAINSLHSSRNEATVYAAQESLAELTGMIHKGYLLHLTVTDAVMDNRNNVGNKIAILSGDYFISKACLGLARLQNTYVSLCVCVCVCCSVCLSICLSVCLFVFLSIYIATHVILLHKRYSIFD